MNRKRKIYDITLDSLTYLASIIGTIILVLILGFVFRYGVRHLSFNFILGTFDAQPTWVKFEGKAEETFSRPNDLSEDVYWSDRWGIGIVQKKDRSNKNVVVVEHIHKDSPFKKGIKYNSSSEDGRTDTILSLSQGIMISAYREEFRRPASKVETVFEHIQGRDELFLEMTVPAGGIRGAVIATLMMIGISLLLAIPFGVTIAIYFNEHARKTKVTLVMRSLIDMLAGVPSIVYGIVGMLLFFRYFPLGGADGGYTILGGALTMVVILLPVIIRSTEEALMTVPQDLRQGSLALGANQTQTILKIVIPSALPGILTAVLLSIGRIIGESAALILVSGTVINDRPRLNQGGATLAVAIWKEMAGEQPNIRVAASISVLIIIIVLILNVLVKLTSRRLKRT